MCKKTVPLVVIGNVPARCEAELMVYDESKLDTNNERLWQLALWIHC